MIIKILLLILLETFISYKIIKAEETEQCRDLIRQHITKINQLNKSQEKIKRRENIYAYIKQYFLKNDIQYQEYSLQEIGFIGYAQKAIQVKIKGIEKTTYNIIVPIEIEYNLKNDLAIAIIITLLNSLNNKAIKNSINIYFIEDDSHKKITTISSRLLLDNNFLEKNTNTIYLMLNSEKENNPIQFENQSNIINSKTSLSLLEILIKTFDNNKVNFKISKINDKNTNEIYNLYLKEEIPILIINNNKDSMLKYLKNNNICDIYKSIKDTIEAKKNTQKENTLHYIVINIPFKKWIINENTLMIIIYAIYNLIILTFITRFKKTSIIIRKTKENYHKIIQLFLILFLSTYISTLLTNKMLNVYENFIDYKIINPIYLVNFFLTLFIFNLISYFTYDFKIHLTIKEIKYLAIAISVIELIMILYIKIEFILLIILKSILILTNPNKIKILKQIIIIIIWIINFTIITSIQASSMISKPIPLSYFISISLFSVILTNIVEHLKHKTNEIKQEFKKYEKIESIIFLLIIAITIMAYNIDKIETIKIDQIISFPEKINKIKIKYLQANRNAIQILTKDFHLNLNKNKQYVEKEINIQEDLIDLSFKKTDAAERTIYEIKIATNKIAKQINLFLKNASELIIYQSNTPYKIASNNIIFTINNIKSNIINITFTIKSQEEIKYETFAHFDVNEHYIKIYDKESKKEVQNINIDYSYTIKYAGILPKSGKYEQDKFFKLQNDKEIENLKNLKIN